MSVYVDPLFECTPNKRWRWSQASHLMADTLDELHGFAERLGMKREWFQGNGRHPHYDLSPERWAEALRLGAQEVDSRELIRIGRKIRTFRGETLVKADGRR